VVVGTKLNPTSRAPFFVQLLVKDVAGNQTLFDPLIADLVVPAGQQWVTETYSEIPPAEGHLTILNGRPGVWSVRVAVNGNWSRSYLLRDTQILKIDLTPQMRRGELNTISVAQTGIPGARSVVVISE
jgi:hypothetical protein